MSRRSMICHPGLSIAVMAAVMAASCSNKPRAVPVDPVLQQAEDELQAITDKFPSFRAVPVAASGTTTLAFADSMIVEDIRGVQIDDSAPSLQGSALAAPSSMVDGFAEGQAPYHANGILPFRFRYFTNANSYQGWHTWNMAEYASTHGFGQTDAYNSDITAWQHLPEGTQFYDWGVWDWDSWMTGNSIGSGRYDQLPDLDTLTQIMLGENFFYATRTNPQDWANSMADMEHGLLSPSDLQAQAWYPSAGTQAEKDQFEADYYRGYANTNMSWMRVAKQNGWKGYGIYGWQPFARQWFGLDMATADPDTYWRWTRFGSDIFDEVEVLNPSIYCFYWDRKNLAYMLANIDLNDRIVSGKPVRKPVMPWVWPLLHGGGGGWRWWRYQPIADHEMQAMFAAIFFSRMDGFVNYGWSGTSDPHRVTVAADTDKLVENPFTAPEAGAPGNTRDFARYDVIHVVSIDGSDNVQFKFISKSDPNGSLASATVYELPRATIEPALRPDTAGMDAMFEGMALARVFEFFLKFGQLEIDVEAAAQWGNSLPVVRRVKLGPYHVIVAYDPFFEDHAGGRTVTLTDFDGVSGRTIEIPVNGVVRIWVLKEA